MLKKPGMILLTMCIGTLLSGCLVDKKDVETISRTTESLRVYQPNDFIEYNVTAIIDSDTTSRGTLHVEWKSTNELQDPIHSDIQYPVLKETSTLTYDVGSSEEGATVIRYISQDTGGNVTLYAIDDGTGLYWLYDPARIGNLSSDVILPVVFDSPMAVGTPPPNSPLEFLVMEGCGTGLCGEDIYKFNDSFEVVGDSTSVTTNLGKFSNPFEITFSGGTIPHNSPTIGFWGDIRDACGTSSDTVLHNGTMFIMPEIGIVRMTNLCQNITAGGGHQVNYIITLNDTNIPLP